MYSIPDPWARQAVFPQIQMAEIQGMAPAIEVPAQRMLPAAEVRPLAERAALNEAIKAKRAQENSMFHRIGGVRGAGIAAGAAIGIPLVGLGMQAAYNHFQNQEALEREKANALINHHLGG